MNIKKKSDVELYSFGDLGVATPLRLEQA